MSRILPVFLLILLGFAGWIAGEPAYLTFLSPGKDAIQPSQVLLKLEEFDAPVSEVIFVDTANRSREILSHPSGRRLYAFVFDFIFASPQNLLQARKATAEFIEKIPKEDLILIAGITPQDGLKVFCTPTTDHGQAIAGLNWIGQKQVQGMMEGPEGNLYSEIMPAESPVLIADNEFLKNLKGYAVSEKDKKELRPVLLQSMADLGFLLSASPGRKHVMFFTPGAATGGLSINLPLRTKTTKGKKTEDAPDAPHEDLDSIMDTTITQDRINKMTSAGPGSKLQKQTGETLPELFAGTDAHLYIVHDGQEQHDLFKKLAARTGGSFLTSVNELTSSIDTILNSDKTYYALRAEAPTDKMKDLNQIKLQISGREFTASPKWLIPRPAENLTPLEKKAKIAESIHRNNAQIPTSFTSWADFVMDPKGSLIPSFVQIDGPSLLKGKSELLDFEFYAFVKDQQENVLDYSYFVFSLDLTNKSLQETLQSTGVKLWTVLIGNHQATSVHWNIVNLQTNEMSSHTIFLDGLGPSMTMAQPFIPAMNLKWIVWPNPTQPLEKRGTQIHYPYREGKDMLFFPDFQPVLKKSVDGQILYMRVYNLPVPGKVPEVRLSLVDSSGKANEVRTLGLLQNPTPLEPKGMGLFWKLAALPEIPAGNYQLKITTMDPSKNQEITRQVKTIVQ